MIAIRPCQRLPRIPAAFAALIATWSFAVLLVWALSHHLGIEAGLCHVKTFTGFPCAACGGTRAAMSLVHGDVAGAARFNPLVTLSLIVAAVILGIRLLAGRQVVLKLGRQGWLLFAVCILAAVGANWTYVAWYYFAP